MAQKAGGGGPAGPASVARSPFQFSVLLDLGRRYLKPRVGLVSLYLLGSLITVSVLPVAVTLSYSRITNFFQSSAPTGAGAESKRAADPAASTPATSRETAPAASNSAAATPGTDDLKRTYGLWVALLLGGAAIVFGHRYLTAYFDGKIANNIRADVFSAILRQSPAFFHRHDSDRLTMIVNQFCVQTQMALRQLVIDPVMQLVGVVIIGLTLFRSLSTMATNQGSQVWILFGIILAFALLAPTLVTLSARRLQQDASMVQHHNLALASLVGGALSAPEEIQAMRAERFFADKHHDLLETSLRSRLGQSVTVERLNAMGRLPSDIVLILLIGLAVYLAVTGARGLEPGTIVAIGLLSPQLMGAVQGLSSFTISASMTWPAVDTVNSILVSGAPQASSGAEREIPSIEPLVEARDVVFSYRPGELRNVLDGITFELPPGRVTGFIARPGRGKTTFFRLALRFYQPQQGDILIGGHRAIDFTLESLRRHVVLMSQFPAFFYGSTRDNFRVARPDVSDAEIKALCERTSLWPILEANIGQDPLDQEFAAGKMLSGGQKKLFALTRCLITNPSVLLMDEPTVGMGPLEKNPLIPTMQKACEGKTVIVVDHDILWQVKFCHYFIVLDEGKIVQRGSAAELMAQPGGLFRQLYDEASGSGTGAGEGPPGTARKLPGPEPKGAGASAGAVRTAER
jgi:ATP-binding cassette subfamily B protein